MKLIHVGNGERITFEEYDRRNEIELRQKEAYWLECLQNPDTSGLLQKGKQILEQKLQEIVVDIEKFKAEDIVLGSIWRLGLSKKLNELHHLAEDGCPFNVHPFSWRDAREMLEKKKAEYENYLRNIGKLIKGEFGPPRKAKPSDFESPL